MFRGKSFLHVSILARSYCQSALGGVLPFGVGCIIRLDTICLDKRESGECHIMLLSCFDAMTSVKLVLMSSVLSVFNV